MKGFTFLTKAPRATSNRWIQSAIKRPGALRSYFGVTGRKTIPKTKITNLISSLENQERLAPLTPEKLRLLRQAVLARTLRSLPRRSSRRVTRRKTATRKTGRKTGRKTATRKTSRKTSRKTATRRYYSKQAMNIISGPVLDEVIRVVPVVAGNKSYLAILKNWATVNRIPVNLNANIPNQLATLVGNNPATFDLFAGPNGLIGQLAKDPQFVATAKKAAPIHVKYLTLRGQGLTPAQALATITGKSARRM